MDKDFFIQTSKNAIIHCFKYNYDHNYFGTGESSGKIMIFEKNKNEFKNIFEKKIHENSIFDIAWSHLNPKFGSYLASVSYDKKVKIFDFLDIKSNQKDEPLIPCYEYIHENCVNCCEFSPYEYGLILICGSSDGTVSIHELFINKERKKEWKSQRIKTNITGVNCLSFGPSFYPISFFNINNKCNINDNIKYSPMRFSTGGCDNSIYICTCENSKIKNEDKKDIFKYTFNITELKGHQGWIRGIDWLKYAGSKYDTIASCSEDETVKIWKNKNNNWKKYELDKTFCSPVWKVEFSPFGRYLVVLTGNDVLYFFKENNEGKWKEIIK